MEEVSEISIGLWEAIPHSRTKSPLFEELLGDEPGGYTAHAWSHHISFDSLPLQVKKTMSVNDWHAKVRELLEIGSKNGLWLTNGRTAVVPEPGYLAWRTESFWGEYVEKYGLKFDFVFESRPYLVNPAINRGAEDLKQSKAQFRVSMVDPVYEEVILETLSSYLRQYGNKKWIYAFSGSDEPMIKMPNKPMEEWGAFSKQMAHEVLNDYGFGKFPIPAGSEPSLRERVEDLPFQWIAFNRWASDNFVEGRKKLYTLSKAIAPDVRFNPGNFFFIEGFVPFDYTEVAEFADLIEGDPYVSALEQVKPGRGMYNPGFGAKLLSDLTGKPVRIVIQAWDYRGYPVSPLDLREWVSQSLRSGANAICYYQLGNPYWNKRELWDEMLHISKVITTMNRIERPQDADTAIYYSGPSHSSQGDIVKGDEIYSAYALLGERVGSWFDFVSDTQLKKGMRDLSDYKVVYIPFAKYETEETIERIENYVVNGGTLVIGDPEAFSWRIDGDGLSQWRYRLTGVKLREKEEEGKEVSTITLLRTDDNILTGLSQNANIRVLPAYREKGSHVSTAKSIDAIEDGVQVLANYDDGTPAITLKDYGKGRVIYFAFNPFVPLSLVVDNEWDEFFAALQSGLGCKVDLPIWHFFIPPAGSNEE